MILINVGLLLVFFFVQQGKASSYFGLYGGVTSCGVQLHKKTALAKGKEIQKSVLSYSDQVAKWLEINKTIKWKEWGEFFKNLKKAEKVDDQVKWVGWGKHGLRAGEDYTVSLRYNKTSKLMESYVFVDDKDTSKLFKFLESHSVESEDSLIKSFCFYGGFGNDMHLNSLLQAAQKISEELKSYRDFVGTVFGNENGFHIEPAQDVRIEEFPGVARQIFSKRAKITNNFFPNFQADLLLGSDPQKDGDKEKEKATELICEDFLTAEILCHAVVDALFEHPRNVQTAWNKTLIDCIDLQSAPVSTSSGGGINLSDFSSKDQSLNATFGVLVGVQKSFLAPHAHFGGYLGVEVFYERGCGILSITSTEASSRVFYRDERMFVYDEKMPAIHNAIHIKARNSLGVTGLLGVTTRDQWTLYVPISTKLTFYNMEFCPDTAATRRYDRAAPVLVGVSGKNAFQGTEVSMRADQRRKNDGYKIDRVRLNLELGVGVRLKTSRRTTLGFRWMHSVGSQLNFDTPPYESKAVHDLDRLGAHHSIHLGTHQFTVELLWKLH